MPAGMSLFLDKIEAILMQEFMVHLVPHVLAIALIGNRVEERKGESVGGRARARRG